MVKLEKLDTALDTAVEEALEMQYENDCIGIDNYHKGGIYREGKAYEDSIKNDFNVHSIPFVEEGLTIPIFYGNLRNIDRKNNDYGPDDFYFIKTKITKTKEVVYDEHIDKLFYNNKITDYRVKFNKFIKYFDDISMRLKQDFIKCSTQSILFLGIPGSKKDYINIPQLIAKYLNNGRTECELVRIEDKQEAHVLEGKLRNDIDEEIKKGLELTNVPNGWEEFDYIVLLDDVTTTGSSFRVVNELLIEKYNIPINKIVNYAFYKHQKVDDWDLICKASKIVKKSIPDSVPIDGIIWDFDETIVDSRVRIGLNHLNYKGVDFIKFRDGDLKHKVYPGLKELFKFQADNNIPYAVISNRSSVMEKLFLQVKLFSTVFPKKENDKFNYEYYKVSEEYSKNTGNPFYKYESEWLIKTHEGTYKPSPKAIGEAINKFRKLGAGKRIIGIGNTKNDIIAYNALGIESVLVTWGIKYRFEQTYGADYVFHTPEELMKFLSGNCIDISDNT